MLFFFIYLKTNKHWASKKKNGSIILFLILFFKTPHYVGIALCNHE